MSDHDDLMRSHASSVLMLAHGDREAVVFRHADKTETGPHDAIVGSAREATEFTDDEIPIKQRVQRASIKVDCDPPPLNAVVLVRGEPWAIDHEGDGIIRGIISVINLKRVMVSTVGGQEVQV